MTGSDPSRQTKKLKIFNIITLNEYTRIVHQAWPTQYNSNKQEIDIIFESLRNSSNNNLICPSVGSPKETYG